MHKTDMQGRNDTIKEVNVLVEHCSKVQQWEMGKSGQGKLGGVSI